MKTTTNFLATVIIALSTLSLNSKAQTEPMNSMSSMNADIKLKIGVGASAGITRDSSPFSYALGADVRLQLDLSPYVAVTASGGYTRLFTRDNFPTIADYDFIPAIGGVKVFPIKRMFLAANIGAGFAIKDGSKTSLIFGGGTGYEWSNGFEVGIRYEGYQQDSSSSTYQPINGQYALRIGYNF